MHAHLVPRTLSARVARFAPALLLGLVPAATLGCGKVTLPTDPSDAGLSDALPDPPDPPDPIVDAAVPPVEPSDLSLAHAFEIRAVLTYADTGFPLPPDVILPQHAFVMRLDDAGLMTDALAGVGGTLATGQFSHMPGGQRVLTQPLVLPATNDSVALCGFGDIRYDTMLLDTYDVDGDGRVDLVQGTATGSVDSFALFEFTATITGTLDTTPPRLTVRGPLMEHSVLRDVVVEASEPLRPTVGLTMTSSATGEQVELVPSPADRLAVMSFTVPANLVLAFGDTLQLEATAAIEDLAGNAGTLDTPTVTTLAQPPFFPQDGFESGTGVASSGDVELISSVGTVSALAGTTSLMIGPGSSALLRLDIPDGRTAASLGLSLRGLYREPDQRLINGQILMIAPNTSLREVSWPTPSSSSATGDSTWPYAGSSTGYGIGLPTGTAGELLVVLRLGADSCSGSSSSGAGVLVDNVVVNLSTTDPPQPVSVPATR